MENEDSFSEVNSEEEPQVFKPEREDGKWTFSRRDFLMMAITTAAGAAVALLPGVKDVQGLRVQVVAHTTELTQSSLQPGQPLTKVWYLKNNATQPWGEGAVLNLIGAGVWQAVRSIHLPNLAPGKVTPIRVSMVAPADLDPRPIEATVELTDGPYKIFLPIIHKSTEPPCACDSYSPCTCHNIGPCACDTYYCPCDYEVPCVCDTYYCACDYLPPCTCDTYVPCSCDHYVPCGCDGYIPCGCVYFY